MSKTLSLTISPQVKNEMACNLRRYLNEHTHGLREHQVEALTQIEKFIRMPIGEAITPSPKREELDDGDEFGIKKGDFFEVVSATGTGKTRMFGSLAHAIDMPTLIVTPRNLLNKQTKQEFAEEIGINEQDIAVYDSKQSQVERSRVLESNPPPKIVITSYQSLPSLVKRHEIDFSHPEDKHYRPLILLDEVHKAQGAETTKILKTFMGKALVGGFTATDAGASETLFHGQKPIFDLGIVPAIEKGLLCHGVRTGLIDVKLDDEWAKSFANTPKGRDYKLEDIEKFAREPAVINAAVKFHLTTDDEQLGKLSRLPTVFFTQGVAAARKGAEEYNKMAQELGVDSKAAYVSGDSKDRDQVIADFKAGKIQALFNDQVLEMGFDAPNATVCYSLKPTHVSHVAEQQLGRVTRRQSEKPEDNYFEKYGMDKVALAINVRGDGMNPILFGEILGGAPTVYSKSNGTYKPVSTEAKEPAQPKQNQWIDGVRITTDFSEMEAVLANSLQEREDLPLKTEEWLGKKDMALFVRRSDAHISDTYTSLQSAWEQSVVSGNKNFSADGITIPTDRAGMFRGGVKKVFCIHRDESRRFEVEKRTDEWLGIKKMAEATGKSPNTLQPIYKELHELWLRAQKEEKSEFSLGNLTISISNSRLIGGYFCLHASIADSLVEYVDSFRAKEKTEAFLNITEAASVVGCSDASMSELYKNAENNWRIAKEKGLSSFSVDGLSIPTDNADLLRNGVRTVFHLHRDVINSLPKKEEKSDQWLGVKDMGARIQIAAATISPIYKQLENAWRKAIENGDATFSLDDLTIATDKAGILGNRNTFCLNDDIADDLRSYIKKPKAQEKTAQWLIPSEMTTATRKQSSDVSSVCKMFEDKWNEAKKLGNETFNVNGFEIRTNKVDKLQVTHQNSSTRLFFCLHESLVDTVKQIIEAQKAEQKAAKKADTFAEMVGTRQPSYTMYDKKDRGCSRLGV